MFLFLFRSEFVLGSSSYSFTQRRIRRSCFDGHGTREPKVYFSGLTPFALGIKETWTLSLGKNLPSRTPSLFRHFPSWKRPRVGLLLQQTENPLTKLLPISPSRDKTSETDTLSPLFLVYSRGHSAVTVSSSGLDSGPQEDVILCPLVFLNPFLYASFLSITLSYFSSCHTTEHSGYSIKFLCSRSSFP